MAAEPCADYLRAQSHVRRRQRYAEAMKKEYDFKNARRGPVIPVPPGKTRVTIRLDNTILDWFRKQVDEAAAATTRRSSTMR